MNRRHFFGLAAAVTAATTMPKLFADECVWTTFRSGPINAFYDKGNGSYDYVGWFQDKHNPSRFLDVLYVEWHFPSLYKDSSPEMRFNVWEDLREPESRRLIRKLGEVSFAGQIRPGTIKSLRDSMSYVEERFNFPNLRAHLHTAPHYEMLKG